MQLSCGCFTEYCYLRLVLNISLQESRLILPYSVTNTEKYKHLMKDKLALSFSAKGPCTSKMISQKNGTLTYNVTTNSKPTILQN